MASDPKSVTPQGCAQTRMSSYAGWAPSLYDSTRWDISYIFNSAIIILHEG